MNSAQCTPSQEVLDYLHHVDFVGVVGPTAVGKSTLISRALERDPSLHLVCSTTSREPRPGELSGDGMHFRSKAEMERRMTAHEYVQTLRLFDNIYATAPEDYSEEGVSILPMAADAAATFRSLPFHSLRIIYVLPPSFETWRDRIDGRATNELDKRMAEAVISLQFALQDPDVVFVLNDDLDVATESFIDVLHGHTANPDQQVACRRLAEALLAHLQQLTVK